MCSVQCAKNVKLGDNQIYALSIVTMVAKPMQRDSSI